MSRGHLDETEFMLPTYLDDNDITKLALINKLNEIKNNGDLSNDKRSEETKSITINCKIFRQENKLKGK